MKGERDREREREREEGGTFFLCWPDERVEGEKPKEFPSLLLSCRGWGRGQPPPPLLLLQIEAFSLVRTGEGAQGQRRLLLLELHRLPPSPLFGDHMTPPLSSPHNIMAVQVFHYNPTNADLILKIGAKAAGVVRSLLMLERSCTPGIILGCYKIIF